LTNIIHSSACVSSKAELGNGNTIGPFVVIEDDVVLGNNNNIEARCSLKKGTRIGSKNTFHEGVVFSGNPQDTSFKECDSMAILGDENVLREYVIIHRGSSEKQNTSIGNQNFIMNGSHIGHDCQLMDNIIIAPYAAIAGHVLVENNAFISGGVVVHQFITIGCYAMIGGNSKITQGVLPYMITDGVPGAVKGLNSVGLKRAGFSLEAISSIKSAFKILFHKRLDNKDYSLEAALEELQKIQSAEIEHIVNFIKSQKRGFHRVAR